ncbi:MAG: ribonuclease H [Parcubacteria group bacterium CG10_big_fil_rev_8_21_14_0_10_36_14]|nr:MAG: ribonuclease H [Parcubacteria group bacterium CG10_big_fil_rev_8_21_14_0_10_36_14]
MKLTIFTDGGARGNPGPAGIGVVIKENGRTIKEYGKYIGETTNNQAEYRALISALETAKEMGAEEVNIFMDSELIVKQVKGEYKVKHPGLAPLFLKLHNLRMGFKKFSVAHIRRERNTEADALVNKAIDEVLKN